jgi:beta-glucosidase
VPSSFATPPGRSGRAGLAPDTDRALLARLSLTQKVALLTGADSWRIPGCPEIGLRPIVTSDGPSGVRGRTKDERTPSTSLPCPSALGATWDPGLVHELAAALGREARGKAVDVLLGPTLNLMRTPLGGRGFEFFAEDPVLTARLAVAYVQGLQSAGVAATPKHFVANDSETRRWAYDARVAGPVLRELYLAPFEACVTEAQAMLVMAAYNRVNGTSMTENPALLRDVLKDEWGFDGVVVSDWNAARSTEGTALGGLDLSMPGPSGPWAEALVKAVEDGTVAEALVDDKVLRLLRLARRVGALAELPEIGYSEMEISDSGLSDPGVPDLGVSDLGVSDLGVSDLGVSEFGGAEMISPVLLRRATAASFVLLRNEGGVLPLDAAALSSLTVAGPNAFWPTIQGGGSAGVMPSRLSVPAEAITAALAVQAPGLAVHAVVGCETWEAVPAPPPASLTNPVSGQPGLRLEFRTAAGQVLRTEHRTSASLTWWDTPVPAEVGWGRSGRVVLRTVFTASRSGPHLLGVSGIGGLTVWLDDQVVIDETTAVPDDPVEAITRPGEARTLVDLEAGQQAALRLELVPAADGAGPLGVRLGITPATDPPELLAEAAAAAARSDATVVVVGSAELTESEGFDRATLALPGLQDELIRRVAAVSRRTIVVVNSGMPVLMPWAADVDAIIQAWLPGQAMGEVLADVLTGVAEPGGRLPVTVPAAEADCPVLHATPDAGDVLPYDEGLLIGYRGYDARGVEPRYPFGHGLGYTTWAYESIECRERISAGRDLHVVVTVRNTGSRPGREVVQVYVAPPPGDPERPVLALAAFGSAVAEPGEAARVRLRLPARSFARWDERAGGWTWPAGRFGVHVGRSARDLRLTAEVRSG